MGEEGKMKKEEGKGKRGKERKGRGKREKGEEGKGKREKEEGGDKIFSIRDRTVDLAVNSRTL